MRRVLVTHMKTKYRKATRIEHVSIDAVHAPASGTKGKVIGADERGSLLVNGTSDRMYISYAASAERGR